MITLFLNGLAVWESMTETDRTRSEQILVEVVPERAVRRYEELFRRLAAEFPEFACWIGLVEHQATRTEVRALRTALAGLAENLAAITAGVDPDPTATSWPAPTRPRSAAPCSPPTRLQPGHTPACVGTDVAMPWASRDYLSYVPQASPDIGRADVDHPVGGVLPAIAFGIATNGFAPNDPTRAEYERVVLRHLVNVLHLLPEDWPAFLATAITDAEFDHDEKQTLLTRLGPGHQPASGPE